METIDIHTVNPYTRVAMHSILKRGTVIKQRVIFDYELLYIENGGMTFCYDGIFYPCERGAFVFIRPGVPHSFDCSERDLSQPHIHFDIVYTPKSKSTPVSFKDFSAMSAEERALVQKDLFSDFPRNPFVSFSNPEASLSLFYRVIDCFACGQGLSAKGALTELIGTLIDDNFSSCLSEKQSDGYDTIEQVKDFIDSAYGIGVCLDALEKQFSYSKFHLERVFKKRYGKGMIAYCNEKRMARAQFLLSEKSVTDTALELGFSSIYAFSRAFKNKYGISPMRYKKKS